MDEYDSNNGFVPQERPQKLDPVASVSQENEDLVVRGCNQLFYCTLKWEKENWLERVWYFNILFNMSWLAAISTQHTPFKTPLSALFANVTLLLNIIVTFQNKIVIITLFTLCHITERLAGPSKSVTTANKNFNWNVTGLRILTSLRWNSQLFQDYLNTGFPWTNPGSVQGGSCTRSLWITSCILLRDKFLQFDWLRAVVFQLNLKYLHVKITNLSWVVV